LGTLAPLLVLLPHAPFWRAAEGRLDAVALCSFAMRFGFENIELDLLRPIVIHLVFDVYVFCCYFMARLWRA
jgi:hypothetical protein